MIKYICFIHLLFTSFIFCQDIRFKHITIEDGLSQSTVNCIFQDSQGFIWIGTENGLNRYDGYNFTVFKHEPSDSGSLSHSWIWDVFEDKRNNLWIATWHGLNKYNADQNSITHYLPDPNDPYSISGARPTSIFQDREGYLWIATWGGGINIYDPEKGQFTRLQHSPEDRSSLAGDRVRNIFYASNGQILAATWNGLSIIEKKTDGGYNITNYRHEPGNPTSLSSNEVSSVVEDQSGQFWVGTFRGGLNRFMKESHSFVHYRYAKNDPLSLSSDDVISLFIDSQDVLWIGTVNEGLNRLDRKNNHFSRYKHDPDQKTSLNGNNVFSIYQDNSGLLWVGTNGLNIYDKKMQRFHHYYANNQISNSLNHNRITKFFEDRQEIIWIGTEGGGLNRFDPQTGQFVHFIHDPQNPSSLSNNNISAVAGDQNGNIWIGTRGGGLNRFDPKSGRFYHYKEQESIPETEGIYFINDLCIDQDKTLWLATYDKGLILYDIAKNQYQHLRGNPEDEAALSSDYLLTVFVDSNNNIWIGTWGGGLNCYDRIEKHFTRYNHDPDNPGTISGNIINAIYESKSGLARILWVGTNMGLSYMNLDDPGRDKFKHILEKDGLPSGVVCGILGDESGNLWISTNTGICKFNTETRTFQNYDKNDGLQSNEFIAGSFLKRKNDQFLFGGINGFNAFFADSIEQSAFVPPIAFTSFKIFDKPVSFSQSLNTLERIELKYNQNFFSFEFASLDYTMPVKNQYAYMLEGFDKDWVYSGSRRYVSYTNLDPGNYVLKIKGTNSDGIWSQEGSAIKINIIPPLWQTWWAYGIYSILIIGSVLGMIRMRSWKLEKEKRQLEKIVNERTNEIQVKNIKLAEQTVKLKEMDQIKSHFFANISHEFRTPLTLIKGPAEEMLSKSFHGKPEKAFNMILRNANRLLRLINQLFDLSKLESGSMELKTALQPVTSFISVVISSFSSLAESRNILLQYIKPQEEIEIYFDRDKLEKILYNLLSNAFKFTPENGFITITLNSVSPIPDSYPQGAVEISVDDSGVGIPDDEISNIYERFTQGQNSNIHLFAGSGIGLALTRELVDLHHGEINITSTLNEGTKFDVILPLGKDHLKPEEIVARNGEEAVVGTDIDIHMAGIKSEIDHQPLPEQLKSTSEKHLVLIVEDHPEVRDYIREHLEADYQVIEAENGVMGVNIAKDQLPDLIICDIMMPEMNGYELTNTLKKTALTSHIPIILLTAKASYEARIEGLETGADAYMAKPFNAKELEVRVKKLIEIRTRLREKFRKDFLLEPVEITAVSLNDEFISRVHDTIEKKMADPEFNVEVLLREFALGQRQFTRKVIALTGQTPVQFIRIMRLKRARELIEQGAGSVSEIAFNVGFNNLSYFSKCFRLQFGKLPSELNQ